jgi:WD40 repeat protein
MGNLKYFKIPCKSRILDCSKVSTITSLALEVYLQLNDDRLCGYKGDTTLKEYTGYVFAIIQQEDNRICSSAEDSTIKVWNMESGQCEVTFNGRPSPVSCVIQLIDRRLCSGSYDSI